MFPPPLDLVYQRARPAGPGRDRAMGKLKKRIKQIKFSIRKRVLKFFPDVFHIGRRALMRGILLYGQPWVEKEFANDADFAQLAKLLEQGTKNR